MKRMVVFTKPDGLRFAVSNYDLRQVYQRKDDISSCHVYYQDVGETLCTEVVVGTFDDIMARIEEHG